MGVNTFLGIGYMPFHNSILMFLSCNQNQCCVLCGLLGGGGGVTSIGGRTRCSRKKKHGKRKRVSKSGVGADLEKGVRIGKNGGKGYPNRCDQSSSQAIIHGKGST